MWSGKLRGLIRPVSKEVTISCLICLKDVVCNTRNPAKYCKECSNDIKNANQKKYKLLRKGKASREELGVRKYKWSKDIPPEVPEDTIIDWVWLMDRNLKYIKNNLCGPKTGFPVHLLILIDEVTLGKRGL